MELKTFTASDSKELAYRVWLPAKNRKTRAVLQILHGMAEHGARYDDFARYLTSKGVAVYIQDHRGHGATIDSEKGDVQGFFAEENGWQRVVDDAFEFSSLILNEHPGVPFFLMGHSMGSFMARSVMVLHPDTYDGVIIMGTGASQGLIGKIGKIIAKAQVRKNGPSGPSQTMNKLCFGGYNKAFEPSKTPFDWLSRDEEQVARYIEDPLCGFVCSGAFYYDLITGVETANSKAGAQSLPKDLPLLIISGGKDPVGANGTGVQKVFDLYHKAGLADVKLKIVEGARHELLNETDRQDTYSYLFAWMLEHI